MAKLVRDLIPEIIPEDKKHLYHFSSLSEEEYSLLLKEKLVKEAKEYFEAENIEELADIFEVIDAIIELKKFSREEVFAAQKNKRESRGGFQKRIFMQKVE